MLQAGLEASPAGGGGWAGARETQTSAPHRASSVGIGAQGGRVLAGSSLARDIVRCLMIVFNSAGAQCARVRLGTARSGADARRLSSPRTVRCVAGGVSPVACAVAVASNSSTLEYSVLICSTEHSAGNCGPTCPCNVCACMVCLHCVYERRLVVVTCRGFCGERCSSCARLFFLLLGLSRGWFRPRE